MSASNLFEMSPGTAVVFHGVGPGAFVTTGVCTFERGGERGDRRGGWSPRACGRLEVPRVTPSTIRRSHPLYSKSAR